jgi:hypothetical protein
MTVGFAPHNAAVRWLESERAIEPDPMYRRATMTIHRVTAHSVEMIR